MLLTIEQTKLHRIEEVNLVLNLIFYLVFYPKGIFSFNDTNNILYVDPYH